MTKKRCSEASQVAAFFAGVVVAAGITLLLSPKTGRQMREDLGEIKDEAVGKLKDAAREARFKLGPKTRKDAFYYEGGDCWI